MSLGTSEPSVGEDVTGVRTQEQHQEQQGRHKRIDKPVQDIRMVLPGSAQAGIGRYRTVSDGIGRIGPVTTLGQSGR